MRKFRAADIEKIVKSIPCPVYAPVEKEKVVVYDRYEDGETLRFDTCNTDKSPKDVLFPQWEDRFCQRTGRQPDPACRL